MAIFAVFLYSVPAPALAARAGVPPSCDEDFLTVLETRSWMESQRELEMAQAIILKADSVLQYSCFEQRVAELRANASFSVDTESDPLSPLVVATMNTYLGTNFNHTMGGGLSSVIPGGSGGPCKTMNDIWLFLQCYDFDKEQFLTLANVMGGGVKDIIGNDPRTLPLACTGGLKSDRDSLWPAALAVSFPVPALPAASGGMDMVKTFLLDLLDPAACGSAVAVPTGVMVISVDPAVAPFPDAACSAPSCNYDGTGGCN